MTLLFPVWKLRGEGSTYVEVRKAERWEIICSFPSPPKLSLPVAIHACTYVGEYSTGFLDFEMEEEGRV